MTPRASPGTPKEAPKGRSTKSKAERPATKASKGAKPGGSSNPPSSEGPKSFLLPFITLWLLAAIALGGLIYWGMDQKGRPAKSPEAHNPGPPTGPAAASPQRAALAKNHTQHRPGENSKNAANPPGRFSSRRMDPAEPERSIDQSQIKIDVTPAADPKSTHPEWMPPASAAYHAAAEAQHPSAQAHGEEQNAALPASGAPIHSQSAHARASGSPGSSEPTQAPMLAMIPPSGGSGSLSPLIHAPTPSTQTPVARVAIVIDDFGPDLEVAKRFLELPISITFSILPFQTHSRDIAALVHSRHHEVLLHMPMEPLKYPKINPGKGALLVSMSAETIQKNLRTALDASPYISGMNNHEGSRFTENAAFMKLVLSELRNRGLYFLDSCTSPKTVGAAVARELQVPCSQRDIFLDNTVSEEVSRAQIEQLIRRAKIRGSAIAIGHPHKSTLRALSKMWDRFRQEKIAVVPVGEIVLSR